MEGKPVGIVVKKGEARVDMGRLTRMSELLRKWNVPKLPRDKSPEGLDKS